MKLVNATKNFKKTYNIFETWQSCSKRNLEANLFIEDHSFSTYPKFSGKLIFLTSPDTHTIRNVSFSENFTYVLNDSSWLHLICQCEIRNTNNIKKQLFRRQSWTLIMDQVLCILENTKKILSKMLSMNTFSTFF